LHRDSIFIATPQPLKTAAALVWLNWVIRAFVEVFYFLFSIFYSSFSPSIFSSANKVWQAGKNF